MTSPPPPPRLWRRLLLHCTPLADRRFLLADIEEEFDERAGRYGAARARRWYRGQALRSLVPLLRRRLRLSCAWGRHPVRGARRSWLVDLRPDVAFALRLARSRPAFSLGLVLTLATGIGATTAVYGIFAGVYLRPLPYGEADRLVVVGETRDGGDISVAYPNYQSWRESARSFDQLAAIQYSTSVLQSGNGEAVQARVYRSSASLFAALGVPTLHGRPFGAAADAPGGDAVAVLSHALWRERFGEAEGVVGHSIRLDGEAYTVVGIMPPGFEFYRRADLWTPIGRLVPGSELEDRKAHPGIRVVGRLKVGLGIAEARAELEDIARRLEERYPDTNAGAGVSVVSLREQLHGRASERLGLLAAAVALLLLIASLNGAMLLTARAADRAGEMKIRAALGAGRLRVARQLLVESLVMALMAGLAGVALAFVLVRVTHALDPTVLPGLEEVRLDGRVLLFAVGVSSFVGLVFGAAPALHAVRRNSLSSTRLRAGGRNREGRRVQRGMVALQAAFSVLLVTGAVTTGSAFLTLGGQPLGFSVENVLTFDVELPERGAGDDVRSVAFYRDLLTRLEELPGVRSAATVNPLPLGGSNRQVAFWIEGRPYRSREDLVHLDYAIVTPGYFAAMEIPVRLGRTLGGGGGGSPAEVVVDEVVAARYWPGADPLGRTLKPGGPDSGSATLTVVGVVAAVHHYGPGQPPPGMVYTSAWQWPLHGTTIVRAEGDPLAVLPAARAVVAELESAAPVADAGTLADHAAQSLSRPRFSATLMTLFALAALILATAGVYGVTAFEVARRRAEFGVRMALGARRSELLGAVLRETLITLLLGAALGAVGYGIGASVLRKVVPDLPVTSGTVVATVALALVMGGLLGALAPGIRAGRVQALEALRAD